MDFEGTQVGRGRTGSDGRFEIRDIPDPGQYLVVCAADRLAPQVKVVCLEGNPVDVDVLLVDLAPSTP